MNSIAIFGKIIQRKKTFHNCGTLRNNFYAEYLKTSAKYDSLKKAFYTAVELSRMDASLSDEHLEHYTFMVKSFDKQLLQQMKDRDYEIQDIQPIQLSSNDNTSVETQEVNAATIIKKSFSDRIVNIQMTGNSRNRFLYEFIDSKAEYEKSKELCYKETNLALQDGSIKQTDQEFHIQEFKKLKLELQEEMNQHRNKFNENRKYTSNIPQQSNRRQNTRGIHSNRGVSISRGRGSVIGTRRGIIAERGVSSVQPSDILTIRRYSHGGRRNVRGLRFNDNSAPRSGHYRQHRPY